MKHKHSEVIKAFVDGIECEYYGEGSLGLWYLITDLSQFNNVNKVRIKPETERDVELFTTIYEQEDGLAYTIHATKNKRDHSNLKLIFDGKTNKLKDAEVIK